MKPGAALAVNTAQAAVDIAVRWPGGVLGSRDEMRTGQDAALPHAVQELLDRAELRIADLSAIGVCVGPGSFTGIRIGVAYARGLGAALGVPVSGVTSLEAMLKPGARGLAALPARKRPPQRSWWVQDVPGGAVEEAGSDRLAQLCVAHEKVFASDNEGVAALLERNVRQAAPSARNIAELIESGASGDAAPLYARPADVR